MRNKFTRFTAALLLAILPQVIYAQSTVRMTTQAPAGTELRIYSLPYNSTTISGADKGDFFGIYKSKGPGTEITISGNIDELEVYGCQLTSLAVESAPTMYILKCNDNSLKNINLDNCPQLAVLDCHSNKLSTVDVSKNDLLENLNAAENELISVTLGQKASLNKLDLSGNKLTSANLSGLSVLEDLYIQNNLLSSLDLSKNTKLNWIYAFCNRIEGDAMDSFMANLPEAKQSPAMIYIVDTFADKNTEGNVCLVKNVETARAKGWVTMDFAGGQETPSMKGQFYYGADYEPVISDNGIKFTTSRKAGETVKLYIKSTGAFTVEGVSEESFINGNNTLTLTSSEIFVKGDITIFECPGNDINDISFVGDMSKLTSFDCSDNDLETLLLTGAPAVTQIHAQKNALRSLNIEGCTGIMRVDCYSNNLNGKAMKLFMESLPDGTANNPYLYVIDTKDPDEKNVATTNDVAIAKGKNWLVYDYSGGDNYGMGKKYEGSEPTGPVLPDEYFTFSITESSNIMLNIEFTDAEYYPIVENAELVGWGSNALTLSVTAGETVTVFGDASTLAANFANIHTIDVSACPNLTELNLSVNGLTNLNVSKNAKLKTLLIFGNELESLDVSGCSDLNFIICYGNKLVGDAMTQFMSTLPMRSSSQAGQIIIYDGSYEREHNLCLPSDVEAAYKRYWLTYELVDGNPVRYNGLTGIEDVATDNANIPAEYFNLQGMRVENPENGIYIRRHGRSVTKVLIK